MNADRFDYIRRCWGNGLGTNVISVAPSSGQPAVIVARHHPPHERILWRVEHHADWGDGDPRRLILDLVTVKDG